jgi:DNA-binding winged helix-turn-helix (wHTH) protein
MEHLPSSFRFDAFSLVVSERCLKYNEVEVEMTPQAMDLLLIFLAHAQQRLEKQELERRIWGEQQGDANRLSRLVYNLRSDLEEACDYQKSGKDFIANRQGGYVFLPAVAVGETAPRANDERNGKRSGAEKEKSEPTTNDGSNTTGRDDDENTTWEWRWPTNWMLTYIGDGIETILEGFIIASEILFPKISDGLKLIFKGLVRGLPINLILVALVIVIGFYRPAVFSSMKKYPWAWLGSVLLIVASALTSFIRWRRQLWRRMVVLPFEVIVDSESVSLDEPLLREIIRDKLAEEPSLVLICENYDGLRLGMKVSQICRRLDVSMVFRGKLRLAYGDLNFTADITRKDNDVVFHRSYRIPFTEARVTGETLAQQLVEQAWEALRKRRKLP